MDTEQIPSVEQRWGVEVLISLLINKNDTFVGEKKLVNVINKQHFKRSVQLIYKSGHFDFVVAICVSVRLVFADL